jgi:protein-disulfide isomerase
LKKVTLSVLAVAILGLWMRALFKLPSLPEGHEPTSVEDWRRIASDGPRLGPAAPSITIVVFMDYSCPACFNLASDLRLLRENFPDDLAVVFRHRPRPTLTSLASAYAVQCAQEWGRFEEMHTVLTVPPDSLGPIVWSKLAGRVGIADSVRFLSCIEDQGTRERVERDLLVGDELSVVQTPTILVNHKLFTGSPGLRYLSVCVRRAAFGIPC